MRYARISAAMTMAVLLQAGPARPGSPAENLVFNRIEPCRIIDTSKGADGPLLAGETRSFDVVGDVDLRLQGGDSATGCGIPVGRAGESTVRAIVVHYMAKNPASEGALKAWATDSKEPAGETLSFSAGHHALNVGFGAITPIRQDVAGQDISIYASEQVDLVATVVGYYTAAQPPDAETMRALIAEATTRVDGLFTNLIVDVGLTTLGSASHPIGAERLNINGNVRLLTDNAKITSSRGLILEETGDDLGTMRLSIVNRFQQAGALFEQLATGGAKGVADFIFKPNVDLPTLRRNLRLEARAANDFVLAPEFQIGEADNPTLVVADNNSSFRRGNLGIGSVAPADKLHVVGDAIVTGVLVAADTSPNAAQAFNSFGTGTADEDITSSSDLYVSDDIELDGQLFTSTGTAATPAIAFGGDTNTGIYRATTDAVGITAGGVEGLRVTSSLVSMPGNLNVDDGVITSTSLMELSDDGLFCLINATGGIQLLIGDGDNSAADFDGAVNANGIDYAEAFLIDDRTLAAGDVVSLKVDRPEHVERSSRAYDSQLVGVVSTNPGFVTGNSLDSLTDADPQMAASAMKARAEKNYAAATAYHDELVKKRNDRQRSVALLGRVPIKVDGQYGPIRPGDHLTSSATPGYATTMTQAGRSIGIAIEGWSGSGKGKVLAFIQPGWYDAGASAQNALPVIEAVEAGDVLVADRDQPGSFRKGADEADNAVIGIASASGSQRAPVATSGTVLCKVDASYGAIRVGDLLMVSPTPGHAMVSADAVPGTVLGKALQPLASGQGKIQVMVMLR